MTKAAALHDSSNDSRPRQKFDWKIEIGLYLAHYSGMYCYNISVLYIGLFQFSSQISVTLVSVLFTPPLVNPI